MKTPLGTEVELGHTVLIGTSSPLKGHSTSLFLALVYCGHGRPSQVLLSSCYLLIRLLMVAYYAYFQSIGLEAYFCGAL